MKEKKQKYTMAGVQQQKVLDLNEKISKHNESNEEKRKHLDLKDTYVMSYMRDLNGLRKIIRKRVEGKVYFLLGYAKLIEYMPLLGFTTSDVLRKRLSNYEKLGLIKRHFVKLWDNEKKKYAGTDVFIHLEEAFFELFEVEKLEYSDEEFAEKQGLYGDGDVFMAEPDEIPSQHQTDPDSCPGCTLGNLSGCIDPDDGSGVHSLYTPKHTTKENDVYMDNNKNKEISYELEQIAIKLLIEQEGHSIETLNFMKTKNSRVYWISIKTKLKELL